MKRRRRPLLWLFPIAASLIVFFLVRIFYQRPTGALTAPPQGPSQKARAADSPEKRGEVPERPAPPAPGPQAAIIIDDVGYSLEAVESILAIGRPITVSILPDAARTEEAVRLASGGGLEIMLHLPFESAGEKNGTKIFEGTISGGLSAASVRAAVARGLARVPGAAGVNNHTGSAATEERRLMRPVLEVLKARGLYFIDSRTTRETVAYEEAVKLGVRTAFRNVFLDAEPGEANIAFRLKELFRLAKQKGTAVGICHPKADSLAALARHIGLAEAYGVKLVYASAIVR
jgi:hypothetical protein